MQQPPSLHFQQKQQQSLKQTQRLIMSPQMQQALHLLQMPIMELSAVVSAEMEQNPVLEYDEGGTSEEEWEAEIDSTEKEMDFEHSEFEVFQQLGEEFQEYYLENEPPRPYKTQEEKALQSYMESSIQSSESLFQHLMKQAKESFDGKKQRHLAKLLIGNFDERGFLTTPIQEIALLNEEKEKDLLAVLKEIQTFSPAGVGAKDLQESLLIQLKLRKKANTLAYQIVQNHFDDMLHNRLPAIRKKTKASIQEIQTTIQAEIAKLDLHPGITFSPSPNHPITPDVTLQVENGTIEIFINEDSVPGLKINRKYLKMLSEGTATAETKDYIKSKISSGKWLMRNIYQRNDTLHRIVSYISKKQKKFFMHPEGKLKPMTMKEVAEALEVHESTVARACTNKYLACDKGLYTLRSFFTNAYARDMGSDVSSTTVKDLILEIIQKEDKAKPLSDEAISLKVSEKGIHCARRTVAKYRYELGIGNTSQRRQYH